MSAFTQLESSLEEENLFMGSCSIPSDDVTSWVTKYMFNVSYDRKQFTQSFSFYTYQSECQQHLVENGLDHFTLKVYLLSDAKSRKKIKHVQKHLEPCPIFRILLLNAYDDYIFVILIYKYLSLLYFERIKIHVLIFFFF